MADSPREQVDEIHAHLEATEDLPIDASANRWIGEAEAVARDVANADVSPAVLRERLGHVHDLLSEVDETGNAAADEHVAAARAPTRRLLGELDDGGD